MANSASRNPQTVQKHPDEWNRDLNPNQMKGQNIGEPGERTERSTRTAFDVKPVHDTLRGWQDDELKQIPILDSGTRLRQGATYLDLHNGPFTATGDMAVRPDQAVAPKDGVHYDTWNKLTGADHR